MPNSNQKPPQREEQFSSARPYRPQLLEGETCLTAQLNAHRACADAAPQILRMPNEILNIIAWHIFPARNVEVMEGVPRIMVRLPYQKAIKLASGHSEPALQWNRDMHDARNMVLVCRQFQSIMERIMYDRIAILEDHSCETCDPYPRTDLPYLVRTLLERPDLARRCRRLDTWIRDRRLVKDSTRYSDPLNPYAEAFRATWKHMLSTPGASPAELANWSLELAMNQETALQAVLITLLPSLEVLNLYAPVSHRQLFNPADLTGRCRPSDSVADYSYFDVALRNSSLTCVNVGVPWPIKHFPATTLTTMEIDYMFFSDRLDLVSNTHPLPSVRTLTITINFPCFNGRRLPYTTLRPHIGLGLFLRNMVPNVAHFAIGMPRGTWEYTNALVGNHDSFDTEYPRLIHLSEDLQDVERHPLDSVGDPTSWSGLVGAVSCVEKTLQSLTLPHNWYSSTGRATKPMPRLTNFTALETLSLPRVMVLANPYAANHVLAHNVAAIDFLPQSLKSLTIHQADIDCCRWIQQAFKDKAVFLPQWQRLVLAFRNDYVAHVPYRFREEARDAGVEVQAYWRGRIKVIVPT
ncbi:hypothetical protein ACEQ8H_001175 [Pleosporales sp. CAS-2024a]